jgi:hypothetical protein
MTTGTTEAIFNPIDLEASLGKIVDSQMNGTDDMDCEPVTRTSNNPFRSSSEESLGKDHHSETYAEIREIQRLPESGETTWSMAVQAGPEKQPAWSGEDLELIPDDGDDDFSLSSQEAVSLTEEDLQLEKIQDPASFWDADVPVSTADQPKTKHHSIFQLLQRV